MNRNPPPAPPPSGAHEPSGPGGSWPVEEQRWGEDLILFRPRFDRVRSPRTGRTMQRLVLESPDWVNVVAVRPDGLLVMVRQFRFGTRSHTLETPGGIVDPGEHHGDSAIRELREETGYGGGRWRYLGAVEPNPAIHAHLCHHWLAEDIEWQGDPEPGPGEDIEVLTLALEGVRTAIARGELRHALALSALSRVYTLWPPGR